jgi:RNA polymerase sigma-70 factor (ECF subfamily)
MPLTNALDQFCEAELLAKVAQRNGEALALLYDRTAGVLLGIAHSILRDSSLAEDVVQEVYSQIWDKAATYNPALGKPISWMIVLTRNRALDKLRSQKRAANVLDRAVSQSDETALASDAQTSVMAAEVANAVRSALGTLGKNQRRAIELSFFEGLPHAEVAAAMNEPLGTVKAWIRRGMLELRPKLENHL